MVRSKFTCSETKDHGNGMHSASFSPVYSSEEGSENKKFWDATPSGKLEMSYTTGQHFIAGKTYYLDISEVEE